MQNLISKLISEKIGYKVILEKPKERSFGNFATPIAFSLAKELKKSPKIIAEELSLKIEELDEIESVEPINGFINIRLSSKFLDLEVARFLEEEKINSDKKERILLEFVSANPTGPLHIGHARGAIYGDCILRCARFLGYDIDSEYYINDAGNQIYLLGLSLFLAGKEHILEHEVIYPEQYYRGEYIIDAAKEIAKTHGSDIFEDGQNITILSEIGKEMMLEEIKSNLSNVGISFDYFVSENELYSKWDETREKLEKSNSVYLKDKKLFLKTQDFGDEKDRVVVRDSGEPTYLAGDIIYHDYKYKRGYDRYINIWGADHHGYIARVKSSIKHLGYDESKLEVILSQMVSLLKGGEPYKMSKRAGNFILMKDVVEDIGSDALRFIFLSKKSDTHLEFDVDELKAEDSSNPIFYINYAHARVYSIFRNSKYSIEDIKEHKIEKLDSELKDLLFLSLQVKHVIFDAFTSRQVNKLADYLKYLAAEFHRFYNSTKVVGNSSEKDILKVLMQVARSIKLGFSLMGIEAKESM